MTKKEKEQEKKFEVFADDVFDESNILKIEMPKMRMALGKRTKKEEISPLLVLLKSDPELINNLMKFKGSFTDFSIIMFSLKKTTSRSKKRTGIIWTFEEASISAIDFGQLDIEDAEEPAIIQCEINYSDFIVKSL